ncbi:hypothetical protein ACU4GI_32620 [Cupriavidus basilensis]
MPDSTHTYFALDSQDHATILASLRVYQQSGQGNPARRSEAIHDIATNGGAVISLDAAGIDELCERLNVPGATPEAIGGAELERVKRALRQCARALANWVEIADDEDKRDTDDEALAAARDILGDPL